MTTEDDPQSERGQSTERREVGQHVTWEMEKRGRSTTVVGTIDRAERVLGMVIQTDEGTFPAVRFRIKPDDGSRAVWTCSFADKEAR